VNVDAPVYRLGGKGPRIFMYFEIGTIIIVVYMISVFTTLCLVIVWPSYLRINL